MDDDIESRNQEIYEAYLTDIEEHGEPRWDRIADALPHIDLSIRQMRKIAGRIRKKLRANEASEGMMNDPDDAPPPQEPKFKVTGNSAVAQSVSSEIHTLKQLLDKCAVDLRVWKIKHHVINVWEVSGRGSNDEWVTKQNYQVKAWFEPREVASVDLAVDAIVKRLAHYAPLYNAPEPMFLDGEYLFVPSIFDAHFNKLSSSGSYTIEQAAADYRGAGSAMIAKAKSLGMPVKRILFVVGQDMLHTDNLIGTTTKGTWVETVAHQSTAIDAVTDSAVYVIEQLATVAPVDVIAIPGNHDEYSTYWLGKFLGAWFREHQYVNVIPSTNHTQYYHFGEVLLGIDHGNTGKPQDLALTMAVEAPVKWSQSTHREWLRGHLHKRTTMFHPITEEKGVIVRLLPALCPPDKWHEWKKFIGSHRAAEGLFYHQEHGPAGSFPVFIDELSKVHYNN